MGSLGYEVMVPVAETATSWPQPLCAVTIAREMTDITSMKASHSVRHRLVASVILLIAFLVMASVFAPSRSQAHDRPGPVGDATSSHSTSAAKSLPSLGRLESDRFTIKLFATHRGPRYSILDDKGAELAGLLTAEQVAERFPDLPLPDVYADAPVQLMNTSTVGSDW